MGLADTSIVWRIATLSLIVAFAFMLACVCSDYMNSAEIIPNLFRHVGFWDMCDDTQTFSCEDLVTYLNSINKDPDWVYGARAMVMIGTILQFFNIVLSAYMAYTASSFHFSGLVSAIGCGLSVVFSLIGGIIFVVNANDLLEEQMEMDADPSWSFIMFLISQGLIVLSLGLYVTESCRMD